MAQAAVDHMTKTSFPRKSHKRRYSDVDSSYEDDDPAWQPSRSEQKRKRRVRDSAETKPLNHVDAVPRSPVRQSSASRVPTAGISVELTKASNDMWEMFRSVGTEMIICKEGRRIFPAVEVVIKGLELDNIYSVFISVKLKDQSRYRYNSSTGWMKIGMATQPSFPDRMIPHADSRNTGTHFMRKPLSFKTIKMTNNVNTKRSDQLILLSMRSYVPQITIQCHTTGEQSVHTLSTCDFIAVTSYQRMEVTQLKIKTNQFAAAFRKRNKSLPEGSRETSVESDTPQDSRSNCISPKVIAAEHQTTFNCSDKQSPEESENERQSLCSPSEVKSEPAEVMDGSCPPTPMSALSTDNDFDDEEEEEEEEDDVHDEIVKIPSSSCDDDIPVHIRPFFFELYNYCSLSNKPYHSSLCSSYLKPTVPSRTTGRHRLLSSVALRNNNTFTTELATTTAASTGDADAEISLGLLSDLLAL